jgi:hypothetical protein
VGTEKKKHTGERSGGKYHLQARERSLRKIEPTNTLIFDFNLQNYKKLIFLLKLPILCHFDMEAEED